MFTKTKSIKVSTKFDPEDERIFCPIVSKNGTNGHGLLKKYFIPHLGINICEYCEVEEEGEIRNLYYYQTRKQSRHLISDLDSWREEILRFQNINDSVDVKGILSILNENNIYLENSKNNMQKCSLQIQNFQAMFQERLIAFFKFLEEIYLIKDIIDELKFDKNGKLNLVAIGNNKEREAKYIWMSLLFSKMKRQNLNPENFAMTDEVIKTIKNFYEFYLSVNEESFILLKHLCQNLLPEIAKLENKNFNLDFEYYLKNFPTVKSNQNDGNTINDLRARILELETIIHDKEDYYTLQTRQKDNEILNLKSLLENLRNENTNFLTQINQYKFQMEEYSTQNLSMTQSQDMNTDLLLKLNANLDELTIQNNDLIVDLDRCKRDNITLRGRIVELEKFLTDERAFHESDLINLKNQIDNYSKNLEISEAKIKELNILIERQTQENGYLNQQVNEMKIIIEKYGNNNNSLESRYKELNLVFEQLREENAKLLQQINECNVKIENLTKNNLTLAGNSEIIDSLNRKIDELNRQNSEYTLKINRFNEEVHNLKLFNSELEKLLTSERQKSDNKYFEYNLLIENLRGDVAGLTKQLDEKNQQLESVNNFNLSLTKSFDTNSLLIDQLNAKLDEFTRQNQNITLINSQFSEENSYLKVRISELEKILTDERGQTENKSHELYVLIEKLKLDNENLNKLNLDLNQKIENIHKQNMSLISEVDVLANLRSQLEDYTTQNHEYLVRIRTYNEENNNLKLRISELEHALYDERCSHEAKLKEFSLTKESNSNELNTIIEKLRLENANIIKQNGEFRLKVEELNTQNCSFSVSNDENADLLSKLRMKLDEIAVENEQLNIQLVKFTTENSSLKLRVAELEGFLTTEKRENENKSRDNSLKFENLNSQFDLLKKQVSERDAQIDNLISLNNNLNTNKMSNEEQIVRLNNTLEEYKVRSQDYSIRLSTSSEEYNILRKRIGELEATLFEERKFSENKITEYKSLNDKLNSDIREIKISHENLFLANRELEDILDKEKSSKESISSELAMKLNILSSENSNLKRQLMDLKSDLEKSRSTYEIYVTNSQNNQNNQINELKSGLFSLEDKVRSQIHTINDLSLEKQHHLHLIEDLTQTNNDLLVVREKLSFELSQEKFKNINMGNLNSEINFLKQENTSLKNQLENYFSTRFNSSQVVEQVNVPLTRNTLSGNLLVSSSRPNIGKIDEYSRSRQSMVANPVFITTTNSQNSSSSDIILSRNNSDLQTGRSSYLGNMVNITSLSNTDKYPRDIDFNFVNPTNLILSFYTFKKILNWINEVSMISKGYKLALLYKGSYENFSAKAFKNLCCNRKNTLVVIMTNSNKIIGGFSPCMWRDEKNQQYGDISGKTFVFSVEKDSYYRLKEGDVAIWNKENCGPVFGRRDIELLDACNRISNTIEVGNSFSLNGDEAFLLENQEFTVKDYEVYEVYDA